MSRRLDSLKRDQMPQNKGQTCDVAPFSQEYKQMKNVPIVKAATSYDDPRSGTTYVLVLAQALWFGDKLENSLLNPNQLQDINVKVDDQPWCYVPDSELSIYLPEEKIWLDLLTDGYLSYLTTRTPTNDELENCIWLQLTEDRPWDPYSPDFAAGRRWLLQHRILSSKVTSV